MKTRRKELLIIMLVSFTSLFPLYAWQNPMNLSGQKEMGIGDSYANKTYHPSKPFCRN